MEIKLKVIFKAISRIMENWIETEQKQLEIAAASNFYMENNKLTNQQAY